MRNVATHYEVPEYVIKPILTTPNAHAGSIQEANAGTMRIVQVAHSVGASTHEVFC